MPNYNGGIYVGLAIDSVLNQTLQNWELIIIDNGSTDGSVELFQEYVSRDSRIKLILCGEKIGVARARNKGLEVTKGLYVSFLDADDLWEQKKLEKQIKFFESKPHAQLLFSSFIYIDNEGERQSDPVKIPEVATYNSLLKHNYIAILTVMIRKSALGEQRFSELGHEDYILWLALLKKGLKAYSLPDVLAQYRVLSGSLSRNKIRGVKWVWAIYRTVEKISFLKSIYLIVNISFRSIFKKIKSKASFKLGWLSEELDRIELDQKNFKKEVWLKEVWGYPLALNIYFDLFERSQGGIVSEKHKNLFYLFILILKSFLSYLWLCLSPARKVFFLSGRDRVQKVSELIKGDKIYFTYTDDIKPRRVEFFFLLRFVFRKIVSLLLRRKINSLTSEMKKMIDVKVDRKTLRSSIGKALGDALYYKVIKVLLPNRHTYYFSKCAVIPMIERFRGEIGAIEIQHGVYFDNCPHFFIPPLKVKAPLLCTFKETYELFKKSDKFEHLISGPYYKVDTPRKISGKVVLYTQPILSFQEFLKNEFKNLDLEIKNILKIKKHPADKYDYEIPDEYFVTGNVSSNFIVCMTSSIIFELNSVSEVLVLDIDRNETLNFQRSYPFLWSKLEKIYSLTEIQRFV